ncbi:MAG: hypothetical protein U0X73_13125 [Thermoanaerobaculia bacterium]
MPDRPSPWRLATLALAAGLAAHLAAAAPTLRRFFAEALALAPLDLAARGRAAADELRSPVTVSGSPGLRTRVAAEAAAGSGRRSAIAYTWSYFVAARGSLPSGARVVLDPPETIPYYYGSFLWAPEELELGANPGVVRDEASVAAVAARQPTGPDRLARLRALGYTHRLIVDRRGLTLEPLPSSGGGD